MKLLVAGVAFLSALLFDVGLSVAQIGSNWRPISCSDPCVIQNSPGGIIDLFEAQARQLKADKTRVIVDGPCLSACTILVDITRDRVCLTQNALLGYHKSFNPGDNTTADIPYATPGLSAYINSIGGLPEPRSGRMLLLPFSEAKQFYKSCPT
jgi:hypothetical protein